MKFPSKEIAFTLAPANTDSATIDFISDLRIQRLQMDPIVDYNVHGTSPIKTVPVFKSVYGLDTTTTQFIKT